MLSTVTFALSLAVCVSGATMALIACNLDVYQYSEFDMYFDSTSYTIAQVFFWLGISIFILSTLNMVRLLIVGREPKSTQGLVMAQLQPNVVVYGGMPTSQANRGQPQSYLGQPQSYLGQPQSYLGQPQSYPGQPQSYQGQPQSDPGQPQFNPAQPQSYTITLPSAGATRYAEFSPSAN